MVLGGHFETATVNTSAIEWETHSLRMISCYNSDREHLTQQHAYVIAIEANEPNWLVVNTREARVFCLYVSRRIIINISKQLRLVSVMSNCCGLLVSVSVQPPIE